MNAIIEENSSSSYKTPSPVVDSINITRNPTISSEETSRATFISINSSMGHEGVIEGKPSGPSPIRDDLKIQMDCNFEHQKRRSCKSHQGAGARFCELVKVVRRRDSSATECLKNYLLPHLGLNAPRDSLKAKLQRFDESCLERGNGKLKNLKNKNKPSYKQKFTLFTKNACPCPMEHDDISHLNKKRNDRLSRQLTLAQQKDIYNYWRSLFLEL